MRLQCSSSGALGPLSDHVLRATWRAPSTRATERAQVRTSGAPTTVNGRKRRVAVIGGGITGLAAAHRLAQNPAMQVTLYEKSSRLGGWLQTEHVPAEDGEVCFEYGPRTISAGFPHSLATVEMLAELKMEQELLMTLKDQNAGHARYIYYPDQLVRMPGPKRGVNPLKSFWMDVMSLINKPLFAGLLRALATEWRKPRRKGKTDESIGDFISRRGDSRVADNIFSATFHGIYAGDIYKLSTKAIFPQAWRDEFAWSGVVGRYIIDKMDRRKIFVPYDVCRDGTSVIMERGSKFYRNTWSFTRDVSFFTLKRGMASLSASLHSFLKEARNVDIKLNSQIKQISNQRWGPGMQIELANGATVNYDFVISTTSPRELGRLLSGPPSMQPSAAASTFLQSDDYAVTVMVVNLYFRTPDLNPVRGFGYVIPHSVPFAENPEHALGVVFATDTCAGQDTVKGTKLTVMLGGHWWDGWSEKELPDEKSGIELAKSVLARHLDITEEPLVARARLQRNAIPQYTVGHVDRMANLNDTLRHEFDGRLKVAGAWYSGVGVNDCVRAGRLAGRSVITHDLDETGLKGYCEESQLSKYNVPKPRIRWRQRPLVFPLF